jgi:hypothetical protein
MPLLTQTRAAGAALAAAAAVAGCGTAAGTVAPTATVAPAATASSPRASAIDRLTALARSRYANEVGGRGVVAKLHRVGSDPTLLRTLESGNLAAARAYVARQYPSVWYHWHVSRMRILQGSRIAVDAGVPFVVAPAQMTLHGTGGRPLGTLQVSIQDEIGFVRLMHRNHPVDIVVRGRGASHVRTSLAAAAHAQLPASGRTTIGGRRYQVRSFRQTALGGEPVTVWILTKG